MILTGNIHYLDSQAELPRLTQMRRTHAFLEPANPLDVSPGRRILSTDL